MGIAQSRPQKSTPMTLRNPLGGFFPKKRPYFLNCSFFEYLCIFMRVFAVFAASPAPIKEAAFGRPPLWIPLWMGVWGLWRQQVQQNLHKCSVPHGGESFPTVKIVYRGENVIVRIFQKRRRRNNF